MQRKLLEEKDGVELKQVQGHHEVVHYRDESRLESAMRLHYEELNKTKNSKPKSCRAMLKQPGLLSKVFGYLFLIVLLLIALFTASGVQENVAEIRLALQEQQGIKAQLVADLDDARETALDLQQQLETSYKEVNRTKHELELQVVDAQRELTSIREELAKYSGSELLKQASAEFNATISVRDELRSKHGDCLQTHEAIQGNVQMFEDRTHRLFYMNNLRGVYEEVYAVGGYGAVGSASNAYLNTAERYDPVTKQWEDVTSMKSSRQGVRLVVLTDPTDNKQYIYAVGGRNSDVAGAVYMYLNTAERYDPVVTKHWEDVTSMNSTRQNLGLVVLPTTSSTSMPSEGWER